MASSFLFSASSKRANCQLVSNDAQQYFLVQKQAQQLGKWSQESRLSNEKTGANETIETKQFSTIKPDLGQSN